MNLSNDVSSERKSDLKDLKVVSFESRMADEMENLIKRYGGIPLVVPSMREIPFELNIEALEFAKKVIEGKVDAVILMTGVGTRFLVQVVEKQYSREQFLKSLSRCTIVARGPKPVRVLKEMGLSPTIAVPEPNTWREILATLDQQYSVKDKKVFVQEYGIQNREFVNELKKRGAHVSRVPVYRWALPEDVSLLRKAVAEVVDGNADILLFTNATQIEHVLQVAAEEGQESSFKETLEKIVVASIGPIMSETLRERGIQVDFETSESKMGLFLKEVSKKCPSILAEKRESWKKKIDRIKIKDYEVKPYSTELCRESALMKACRRESTPYTPVWLMRQAGRYMKEYREIRSKVGFLELCKNSDLACEVTVMAQEKLGADAAIIFSDILLIAEAMGVGLEFAKEEGPNIYRSVRTIEDVENLRDIEPEESLGFVFEAIRKTRSALKSDIPLIGFAGAPFTLVSYLVEGKGSENYMHTKTLMYGDSGTWNKLMDKVVSNTAKYVNGQIQAGAQALQIFDSWVGCLSVSDYKEYVQPHMKKLFSLIRPAAPVIHFGTGTAALLEQMREAGGNVIGLDWRVDLGQAWDKLGNVAVQGNLDPMVLLADRKTIRAKVEEILSQARGRPGHIFNLGHGILPQTPVDNAIALVEMVHELSARSR